MPVYPTRVAVKSGTSSLDFNGADSFTTPGFFGELLEDGGYNGGYQTASYNVISCGLSSFLGEYNYYAPVNDGGTPSLLEIYTGSGAGSDEESVAFLGDKFIVSIPPPPNTVGVFIINPAPTTAGIHDGGPYSIDLSLDISTLPGGGYNTLGSSFLPSFGAPNIFTFGFVSWRGATADNEFYWLQLTEDSSDNEVYGAFETPGLAFASAPDFIAQTHDDIWNYTYLAVFDGAGHHFLTEWQPTALGGFTYNNYNVELSDAVDDAIFQQLIYTYGGNSGYLSNGTQFIFSFVDNFPTVSMTAFVFNESMTEYERFDIIGLPAAQGSAIFFIDINGDYWAQGYDDITTESLSYFLPAGPAVPDTPSSYSMTHVFKLPCFTPCTPFAMRRF